MGLSRHTIDFTLGGHHTMLILRYFYMPSTLNLYMSEVCILKA
jgi:hypothetical protein